MIKVTDIAKSYGDQVLFRDLSFTINPKEKIGFVGRNGSGKTTLFQILLGKIEPDAGTVSIPNNYRIGHLEQHIRFTQDTVLKEACLGLPDGEKDDQWKAEKILAGLGFSKEDLLRPPSLFSGGYQIRINLAKVLVSNPDLLLLDEPNNYLDIVAIRWLAGFLRVWRGELLLITHDRSFMDSITTHTMVVHRKMARKVEGDTEKLYGQIAKEEEIHEKTRLNDEKRRKQTELFIRRFRAKARLGGLVQSRIKCLEKQKKLAKLEQLEDLEFSFSAVPFPAAQMAAAHNLSFSYTAQAPLLIERLTVSIGKRERICVIGKNGKGKSTLLKILGGELFPVSGNIKRHPLLRTGYFCQTNAAQLNENRTVLEEVMSTDPDCLPQKARDICGTLMFSGDAMLKKIGVLSGGEKSRVLLGKQLINPCHLLLLDEPTNHLDIESCEALLDAVEAFEGSVIMVTHNEMYLHRLATKLIVFDQGKVTVFEGTYAEFLEDVGWADEGADRLQKRETGEKNSAQEKKNLRKLKADLLREKAKAVRPHEAEIQTLEETITAYETELHCNTELLVKASTEGDAARIAALSKRHHELGPMIEGLYDRLERATGLYEKLCVEYARQLAALE
jgi:ATP-binding cassette subfamily F protein 3